MSQDRIRKLEEVAFDWNPGKGGAAQKDKYEDIWNDMFEELKAFKGKNGHCSVPQKYNPNPKLGHWVSRQRQDYKKDKMSLDRIDKLEEIGFIWNPATGVHLHLNNSSERKAQNNSCHDLDKSQFSNADAIENEFASLEDISQSAQPMPPLPPPQPISPSYMSDTIEMEESEAQLEEASKHIKNEDTAVLTDYLELEAESLSSQLEFTKAECVEATKTNANLSLTNEAVESELSDVKELELSLETAIRERDAAREIIKSLETEKESSAQILAEMKSKFSSMEEKNKHLQREKYELQSQIASKTAALRFELLAVTATNAKLEESEEQMKQLNKALSESNSKLSTSLQQAEDELSAAANENASLKIDAGKNQQHIKELNKSLATANRIQESAKKENKLPKSVS